MKQRKISLEPELCERLVEAIARSLGITPVLAQTCLDQFLCQALEALASDESALRSLLGPKETTVLQG